jgi:hypothetical protein
MRGLFSSRTVGFYLLTAWLVVFLFSCSTSTNETEIKEYTVRYSVKSKTNSVSRIRYLGENKDTVTASTPSTDFQYSWNRKGKTGEPTMLEVTVKASSVRDTIIYQATADATVLYIDTLLLPSIGDMMARRGMTLP